MADRIDMTIDLIMFGQSVELDDFLQPIEGAESRSEVFATSVPVSRSEFYAAGENGFRPDFEFEINPADYSGECVCEFIDPESGITERCRIYRTYRSDPDTLEIYCSRAAGLDERVPEPEPEPTPDPEPEPEPEPTPEPNDTDPEVNDNADTENGQ